MCVWISVFRRKKRFENPIIGCRDIKQKPSLILFGTPCIFCELSLNAKFQLPRLYVSCISTQYSSFDKKKMVINFLLAKFFFTSKCFLVKIFWEIFLSKISFLQKIHFCQKKFLAKFFLMNFF